MSECNCQTKVVVVHKYHRPNRIWGFFKGTVKSIPGFGLFRLLLVLVLIWVVVRIIPGDQPLPFASCQNEEPKADGFAGVLYDAGSVINTLESSPPSVTEIRESMMDAARAAGRAWSGLEAGFGGAPVPPRLVEKPPKVMTAGVGNCGPCPTTGGGGTTSISATSGNWSADQRANAQAIASVGDELGASSRDIAIALTAAIVESGLQNLDHGDGDSVGLFQQRDAWGSFKDRTTPEKAARMFFEGGQAGQRGLFDFKDRDSKDPGQVAQDVQVSAYPDRYAEHWDEANALLDSGAASSGIINAALNSVTMPEANITDSGGSSKPPAVKAAAFIRSKWGFDGTIYGYNYRNVAGTSYLSEHAHGLAIDVMLPLGQKADEITDYFAGPGYKPFGVNNVIHNRQIYNEGRGWHAYTGESPHTDHVHIDFFEKGGSGKVPEVDQAAQDCADVATPVAFTGADTRVASFNVLGRSHTGADWDERMVQATNLIKSQDLRLVGLQEFQPQQYRKFRQLMPGWEVWYPGNDTVNAIAWRSDEWSLLRAKSIRVPYFYNERDMPVVKLQHSSGEAVWVMNVHNPANTHGNAEHKRDEATRRELAMARELDGEVILLGDMNDRSDFYCPAAQAGFHAASPQANCGDDRRNRIDWIVGTNGLAFGNYRVVETRSSDHALIYSDLEFATSSKA